MPLTLNNIQSGSTATVKNIIPKGSIHRRLLDMGFTEGTKIKSLYKSPFGDPTAFLVRGAIVALRHEDCSLVCVDPQMSPEPEPNKLLIC